MDKDRRNHQNFFRVIMLSLFFYLALVINHNHRKETGCLEETVSGFEKSSTIVGPWTLDLSSTALVIFSKARISSIELRKMCTLEKRGDIYILTLTGSDEHRLNPTLVASIRSALRRVRAGPASPSSALVTIAEGKFFSNGFDLAWAHSSQPRLELMSAKLQLLVKELISLPMPTIAAVTGHASAAGMILALSHDYVLMRKDRGFLYMSELDIGLVLPDWFMVLLKCKIGDAKVRSEIILTAAKLTAEMAAVRGVVHSAHVGAEETVEAAIRLGQELVKRGWDGNVYGKNRMVVLNEVLEKIGTLTGEAKTVSKL